MKNTKEDFAYFVIYSFDCQHSQSVKRYQPPNLKSWDMTEGDDQYDYGYLDGDWAKGKHRKYVHEGMTFDKFLQFVEDCNLYMEDIETMGSMTYHGHLPALSFNSDQDEAIVNAYVIPYLENQTLDEKAWDEIRSELLEEFGY